MIAQLAINGLITGMIVALPAVALTLIFSILKFPNFAIGGMLTAGAYLAWAFNSLAGLPLLAAAIAAVFAFSAIMVASDKLVFRPLRDRGPITLLVASMGLSFILENVCRLFFGNLARNFDIPIERPYRIAGLRINPEQITTAIVTLLAMAAVYLLLRHSPLGRAMRAVADNPSLAAARGIDRDRTIMWTWILAASLTVIAGVLVGMDRAIDPMMGWSYIITIFAAAILGGLGSPVGAVLGALAVGLVQELSIVVIEPQYRQAVSFVAIALLLLFRPQGLLGQVRIAR